MIAQHFHELEIFGGRFLILIPDAKDTVAAFLTSYLDALPSRRALVVTDFPPFCRHERLVAVSPFVATGADMYDILLLFYVATTAGDTEVLIDWVSRLYAQVKEGGAIFWIEPAWNTASRLYPFLRSQPGWEVVFAPRTEKGTDRLGQHPPYLHHR